MPAKPHAKRREGGKSVRGRQRVFRFLLLWGARGAMPRLLLYVGWGGKGRSRNVGVGECDCRRNCALVSNLCVQPSKPMRIDVEAALS